MKGTVSTPIDILPSAKVVGKRREVANHASNGVPVVGDADVQMVASTTPPTSATRTGMQTRPKRVMPLRSRRGGPGVGSCDIDLMLLDMRKRRCMFLPLLIPPNLSCSVHYSRKRAAHPRGDVVHLNDEFGAGASISGRRTI